MKKIMLIILGITALSLTACSKSGDSETGTQKQESMTEKAKSMASDVAEKTSETASAVSDKVKEGAEATKETAKEVVEKTAEMAGEVKDKAVAMAEKVPEKIEAAKEAVADKLAAATGSADTKTDTAPSAEQIKLGGTVFGKGCVACHGSGAAGAPKLDDPSWTARKAQGMDVLVEHALKGFQGSKGFMPAKGGFSTLSDDEVKAAVAYMTSQQP